MFADKIFKLLQFSCILCIEKCNQSIMKMTLKRHFFNYYLSVFKGFYYSRKLWVWQTYSLYGGGISEAIEILKNVYFPISTQTLYVACTSHIAVEETTPGYNLTFTCQIAPQVKFSFKTTWHQISSKETFADLGGQHCMLF